MREKLFLITLLAYLGFSQAIELRGTGSTGSCGTFADCFAPNNAGTGSNGGSSNGSASGSGSGGSSNGSASSGNICFDTSTGIFVAYELSTSLFNYLSSLPTCPATVAPSPSYIIPYRTTGICKERADALFSSSCGSFGGAYLLQDFYIDRLVEVTATSGPIRLREVALEITPNTCVKAEVVIRCFE